MSGGRSKATCHPDRKAHGRGLCQSCYSKAHDRDDLPPRRVFVPTCHPDAEYAGRGLCVKCYAKEFRDGKISTKGAACHPERQHCAMGLCRPCYMTAWEQGTLTETRWAAKIGLRECGVCHEMQTPGKIRVGTCWRCRNQARRRVVIEHYSKGTNACACCSEYREAFLTIDHIGGKTWKGDRPHTEGGDHLIRRLIKKGFPAGFRVLCFNCNCVAAHGAICPHDHERAADKVIGEVLATPKEVALIDGFRAALGGGT